MSVMSSRNIICKEELTPLFSIFLRSLAPVSPHPKMVPMKGREPFLFSTKSANSSFPFCETVIHLCVVKRISAQEF